MAATSGARSPAAVGGSPPQEIQELDETVVATVLRDLRNVAGKLRLVLLPTGSPEQTLKELRNWDLWGPLLLCLVLSLSLSFGAPAGQVSLVFSGVFVLMWAGAAVVTLNAQLLGGSVSFFQSVCVLGYCLFPLVIAAVAGLLIRNGVVRSVLVVAGWVWATRASVVFMQSLLPPSKRALAIYPVGLFYLVWAWMVYVE
ncbi:hypothetical protein FNF27_01280 [Cafeteria roenbergensis]|uniref:Protein YIPF n=2 Tax=Cafeteria roenbergensis TaxID=33653 RepID=A0A5A8EHS6_CAFRO|nr:hypothetical protein FNF29_00691 [Cafeteria roenbergensis]KAA0159652.1 hypothetical protein FNF31_04728 [Cafeteria roenbergensis]KAA0177503.1 hypothetical protein FNF27_01280 [Cafeteria roenbergensis]|eukprot:KAA0156580.1 hypothetical protein FNF29_00691 [Cafeteria roenbergensis]